jgi:hypothetical protein
MGWHLPGIDDLVVNLAWSGPGPPAIRRFALANVSAGDEMLSENVAAGAPLRVRSAIRPGRLTRVLWRDAGRPRRLG